MLTLPPKPWRTMRVESQGAGEYTITFLLPEKSQAVFNEIMREYVLICLKKQDRLISTDWESNMATLEINDIDIFMRDMDIRGFSLASA